MNSKEIIHIAQKLPSMDEKIDYLIASGEYFLIQNNFREARSIAEFILSDVDRNHMKARIILFTAQAKGVY